MPDTPESAEITSHVADPAEVRALAAYLDGLGAEIDARLDALEG